MEPKQGLVQSLTDTLPTMIKGFFQRQMLTTLARLLLNQHKKWPNNSSRLTISKLEVSTGLMINSHLSLSPIWQVKFTLSLSILKSRPMFKELGFTLKTQVWGLLIMEFQARPKCSLMITPSVFLSVKECGLSILRVIRMPFTESAELMLQFRKMISSLANEDIH